MNIFNYIQLSFLDFGKVFLLIRCSVVVVVDCSCSCSKPSRFAHFWQGAESLAPAQKKDA